MNKFLIGGLLFIAGGLTTYYLLPNKIETIEVVKVVEKKVNEKTNEQYKKTTKPDGTIVEEKNTQKDVASEEESSEKSYKKTVLNPKKLLIYAGFNSLKPTQRDYVVGFSYNLWGPFEVGGQYRKVGTGLYATIGIRF